MKRAAATRNCSCSLNMKRKRTKTTNSVKIGGDLPEGCWELILKKMDDQDYNSVSLVSKQFLSITNRLRSSLTIKSNDPTTEQVVNFILRFPNLTSLNFIARNDLDYILTQVSTFRLRLQSLKLSDMHTLPSTGLVVLSTTKTLNCFTCSHTDLLHSAQMFLIADCFPELKHIDLSHCRNFYETGIPRLLKRCVNITHLNLTGCDLLPLTKTINFQVPTLEVLNFSYSPVYDCTLNIITKTCPRILQLSLKHCPYVTDKGVKFVLRNCKQLREINLKHCLELVHVTDASLLLLRRPSLTKIKLPSGVVWVPPLVSTNT